MSRAVIQVFLKHIMLNNGKMLQKVSIKSPHRWRLTNLGGWIFVEDAKHGYLRGNGFSRACWGPEQYIGVCMIQHVENLSLDGVEMSELEQTLILRVPKSCHWQWLEVQQLWEGKGDGEDQIGFISQSWENVESKRWPDQETPLEAHILSSSYSNSRSNLC